MMKIRKKGAIENLILIVILIFFLAVSFVIVIFVNDQLSNVISDTVLNDTSVAPDILDKFDTINQSTVQNGFLMMSSFLVIGLMISAFLSSRHPIWIFIYIIVLAVTIFTAAPLANMYQALIEAPGIAGTVAADQGIITYVMQHYVQFILGAGVLSMIIMFSSLRGGLGLTNVSAQDL